MGREIVLRGTGRVGKAKAARPQRSSNQEGARRAPARRIVLIKDGKLLGAAAREDLAKGP